MTIQELAKHYQETGEYLPEAQEMEKDYILSVMSKIESDYEIYTTSEDYEKDAYPLSFENFIDMEIGMWQAHNGFLTPVTGR